MNKWLLGTLVGIALVGCGNTTPSPAGTWIEPAMNVSGICSAPAQNPSRLTFTINEPSSAGAITATLNAQQQGNATVTTYNFTGTLNGSSINLTETASGFSVSVTGSFDFSQKRFTGTLTGKCSTNSPTTGTYTFTAIKQ